MRKRAPWLFDLLWLTLLGLLAMLAGCGRSSASTCSSATCKPAHTETLAAGPYIVDVAIVTFPPVAGESTNVIVTPHDMAMRLTGEIVIAPGLGTDATALRFPLTATGGGAQTLQAAIHLPVRGAWLVDVHLNGPEGVGMAGFPIVAAAPNAIPIWLGWLIGASPVLVVGWIIWWQRRYRIQLLARHTATKP